MDVEKTVQFTVETQAQYTVHLEKLTETQIRQQAIIDRLVAIIEQLAHTIEQRFKDLAEAQQRSDQKQGELAEAQQRNDQRLQDIAEDLNALFKIVDDLIRRQGQHG